MSGNELERCAKVEVEREAGRVLSMLGLFTGIGRSSNSEFTIRRNLFVQRVESLPRPVRLVHGRPEQ